MGKVPFILSQMKRAADSVELGLLRYEIIEREFCVERRGGTSAAALKNAAQESLRRILGSKHGLNVRRRSALELGIQGPWAGWQEAPIAIELKRDVHKR